MISPIQTITWQVASTRLRAIVCGNRWLGDGLATRLDSSSLETRRTVEPDALVCERGWLSRIPDDDLKQIPAIILIDPDEHERWRATSLLAGKPGARVVSIPSFSALSAAEHAMLLMLALRRKLLAGYSSVVEGIWPQGSPVHPIGGQTLGVIGLGRSGTALAERALGFGMRVLYNDIADEDEAAARLPIESRRFDQILREADVVSLHLPANPNTTRLIDAPELALMKSSATLINIADGRLVDEGSLIKALRGGDIAGAGLDTFAYEPLAADSPLIGFENVVLTPRSAWLNEDQEQALWLDEIARHLAHLPR